MSLGIENSLQRKLERRRYRKRQQNLSVVREEDNAQLDMGGTGTLPTVPEAEGDDQPRGERTVQLSFGTGAPAVSEVRNAAEGLIGVGTLSSGASCAGAVHNL